MRLALYQPDIPQNAGAILRLAACMGVGADIIEPCGFVLDDRRMRRVGMDYLDRAALSRHASWQTFRAAGTGRLGLLSTAGPARYTDIEFAATVTLVLGRESAGVPDDVRAACDASVTVPMAPGLRSLNVGMAAAMVLGEALRQSGQLPGVD
ncbi:MAG: tRNA (cytidine(34)-2'-O)-methyltransferase [Alphaproteobacteria bacterium]